MGRLGTNQALATEVVEWLWRAGVRVVCLCPGGRNAPLVEVLDALARQLPSAMGLEVLDFFEERSAAFFALGRAKRDRRPTAVVTTSGTAAAELLPALVEAHYSGTPLVVVTADRPRSYRGTGAPQTIEQVNLFGQYVGTCIDVDLPGALDAIGPVAPTVHLNVCFDEPLLAEWHPALPDLAGEVATESTADERHAEPTDEWMQGLRDAVSPLVILGALPDARDQEVALDLCRAIEGPVLAESSAHLKGRLGPLALVGGEAAARRGFEQRVFDAVVRVGEIPSFRLWRDLETTWQLPVVSVSRTPFRGLTHGLHYFVPREARLPELARLVNHRFPATSHEALLRFDRELAALTQSLCEEFPGAEPAIVRRLSQVIPDGSFVYLGNSLPIREWNQFAAFEGREHLIGENRGANGIDGQISSFLGGAADGRENWALVGDLTTMYDLPSLWALRHVSSPVRVVVINNGGGRIFDRLFPSRRFQNEHAIRLEAWAAMWEVGYRSDLASLGTLPPAAVIELVPDAAQTRLFWEQLRARVSA